MRPIYLHRLLGYVGNKIAASLLVAAAAVAAAAWALISFLSATTAQDASPSTPAQNVNVVVAAAKPTSPDNSAEVAPASLEPSGRPWCTRFIASTSTDDLKEPFKTNAERFIAALKQSGISVVITTTYRPQERSYLMHYASQIVRNRERPATVPAWQGVNIDWVHHDLEGHTLSLMKAKNAARAMVDGYGIANTPVARPGQSAHNFSQAIDMVISGFAGKTMVDAQKNLKAVKKFTDLKAVGATYGVIWYGPEDSVHWSVDGN